MNIKNPAIVLSAHTIGLAVIRALGIRKIPIVSIYYDDNDMGYLSRFVIKKICAPHPERSEEQFINFLITIAEKYKDGLLIPADDETLVTVSKNKKVLEEYYIVACTDWDITKKIIDKRYTYALAESLGISIPLTKVITNESDLELFTKEVEFPCIIKPCQSHKYFEIFRKKMVMITDSDQLIKEYNSAAHFNLDVMIQEYIPGDDTNGVNYNSYFWNNDCYLDFTAQKIRLSPPQFGVPAVLMSKIIPEIVIPSQKILNELGFDGYSCTEFKKDERDGVYKFMEINGRHNRSTLLSVKCGLNFPWLQYKHLVYGELPIRKGFEKGIYWIDFTRDLFAFIQYRKKGKYSIIRFLYPYLKKHIFAVFNFFDLKPFIKRCYYLLGQMLAAKARS